MLPIEVKNREFYGKFLQSCVAAEQGWGVLIGDGDVLRSKQKFLPKGVIIEQNISPGRSNDFMKSKKCKNKVLAWDEEGLIYWNNRDYCSRRFDKASYDNIEAFFCWGDKQSEDIKECYNDIRLNKNIISGNPRFDILRPEFKKILSYNSKKYKDKYGKIILINTKFGIVNNGIFKKDDYIDFLKKAGKINSDSQRLIQEEAMNLQEINFNLFLQMIPVLSKEFSDYSIIIRPHHSEKNNPWINISKKLNNVYVVFDGDVNAWIDACDVMVQYNCTTAVESFILGKTSIFYGVDEISSKNIRLPLVDRLGVRVKTLNDLILIIKKALKGLPLKSDDEIKSDFEYAKKYIANLPGSPSACENIFNYIKKIDLKKDNAVFPINFFDFSFISFLKKVKNKLILKRKKYYKKKFPGLSLKEILSCLEVFKCSTGRFKNLKIIKVCKDLFCIYSE